jgi:hypothetical protein
MGWGRLVVMRMGSFSISALNGLDSQGSGVSSCFSFDYHDDERGWARRVTGRSGAGAAASAYASVNACRHYESYL